MLKIEHSDNKTVYELNLAGVNQITKSFLSEQVASAGQHFLIGNFDSLEFDAEHDSAHTLKVTVEYIRNVEEPKDEAADKPKRGRKPKDEAADKPKRGRKPKDEAADKPKRGRKPKEEATDIDALAAATE